MHFTKRTPSARCTWVALSLAAALASATLLSPQALLGQERRSRVNGSNPAISSYEKWLTEDVSYIITFQEKMRFDQLRTDADREHYRRIAYSNGRFGASAAPGWRTARGRFYITMGPPDQIEDHPERRVQLWRYRGLEGVTLQFDLRQ